MRIAFLGTPQFALPTLGQLVHSQYEIIAVYTQPDKPAGRGQALVYSPVKRAALGYGLPVFQPSTLRRADEVERLAALCPDLLVVVAYGLILPPQVLAIPPLSCLNVHPSLLPRHRGPSPVAAAILAGDETSGVTIMLLDKGVDTGPILAQTSIPISPQDTTGSLTEKLAQLGARLLMETLPLWREGAIAPQPQQVGKATYSRIITKEDGEIDWQLPANEIWRRVRAFQPWPGCYTCWKGKRLKIIQAIPLSLNTDREPGRVVALDKGLGAEVGVQTSEGVLGLLRVQMEGKRVLPAGEFVRGQRDFTQARLPD